MKLALCFFAYIVFPCLVMVAVWRYHSLVEPVWTAIVNGIDAIWSAIARAIFGD